MEKTIAEQYQDELKDFRLTFGEKNMAAIAEGMGQLEILQKKLNSRPIIGIILEEKINKQINSIQKNLIFLIQESKQSICRKNSPQPTSRKAAKKRSKSRQ